MGESSRLVSFEPLLPHSPVSNSTAATAGNTGCSSHTGSAAARRNGTEERRMVNEGFYGPETIKPPKNPVIFDAAKCIRPWKETLISTSSILRSRFSMKNELFPRVEGNARMERSNLSRDRPSFRRKRSREGGGIFTFYFATRPTAVIYRRSRLPAIRFAATTGSPYIFALCIRHFPSPFPFFFFYFILFYLSTSPLERKLNFFPRFSTSSARKFAKIVGKRAETVEKSGTRACKLVHVSRVSRFPCFEFGLRSHEFRCRL